MNRRIDLDLGLKIYSNQNFQKPDLCNVRWVEELTGLKHVGSAAMPVTTSPAQFWTTHFVNEPKLVVLVADRDCTVTLYRSGGLSLTGPLSVKALDSGRGVLILSCTAIYQVRVEMASLPGRVVLLAMGDESS